MLEWTKFAEVQLPFLYLGIPLTCKRLTNNQFGRLVEKIVGKIQHWSAHLLTYARRLQLIKSVSFVCLNYYLQCLPLPKGLTKTVEAIMRTYLWSDKSIMQEKSPVAWKRIYTPKKLWGLYITTPAKGYESTFVAFYNA